MLSTRPTRKGGLHGSYTKIVLFLTGLRSTAVRQDPRLEREVSLWFPTEGGTPKQTPRYF